MNLEGREAGGRGWRAVGDGEEGRRWCGVGGWEERERDASRCLPKRLDKAPPVSWDAWKCFIESHATYLPVSAVGGGVSLNTTTSEKKKAHSSTHSVK